MIGSASPSHLKARHTWRSFRLGFQLAYHSTNYPDPRSRYAGILSARPPVVLCIVRDNILDGKDNFILLPKGLVGETTTKLRVGQEARGAVPVAWRRPQEDAHGNDRLGYHHGRPIEPLWKGSPNYLASSHR